RRVRSLALRVTPRRRVVNPEKKLQPCCLSLAYGVIDVEPVVAPRLGLGSRPIREAFDPRAPQVVNQVAVTQVGEVETQGKIPSIRGRSRRFRRRFAWFARR